MEKDYKKELIKLVEKTEVNKGYHDYFKNKDLVNNYFEIGRLLVEAQGGEERAKYGNGLIKEWSAELVRLFGKGYDVSNLNERAKYIEGGLTSDMYGRKVPKPSHGTINLHKKTASSKILCEYALKLLEEIINPHLLVRRITIYMTDLASDLDVNSQKENVQFDLFANTSLKDEEKQKEQEDIKEEKQIQRVILDIKNKYGKNAILKGMNLEKGATARERNQEIGGHNA